MPVGGCSRRLQRTWCLGLCRYCYLCWRSGMSQQYRSCTCSLQFGEKLRCCAYTGDQVTFVACEKLVKAAKRSQRPTRSGKTATARKAARDSAAVGSWDDFSWRRLNEFDGVQVPQSSSLVRRFLCGINTFRRRRGSNWYPVAFADITAKT